MACDQSIRRINPQEYMGSGAVGRLCSTTEPATVQAQQHLQETSPTPRPTPSAESHTPSTVRLREWARKAAVCRRTTQARASHSWDPHIAAANTLSQSHPFPTFRINKAQSFVEKPQFKGTSLNRKNQAIASSK
eukprot:TRINITY_DN5684_c0_g1_i13.p2 TRINITY_DN5684_c0_g1~~TRINITY_DN5684_c0_g1_i13.p2  ORF type:complete len:134 (+),score=18.60 TRINITY_DN5684_c0_g1_i13:313-714(+)